ncbi:MAG: hypothetical protein L6300_08445 [Syntrophaceae bacterium]|nr:hypothetical protein [Syntrophaceae bacterium]
MPQTIPPGIREDLEKAASLHQRASSDYEKCVEFNKLMSDILGRLEDAGCHKMADRVMGILIDCNPKQGAQCEKAARIGDKMKKFERDKGSN